MPFVIGRVRHLCMFVIARLCSSVFAIRCGKFLSTGGQIADLPGNSRFQMAGQRRWSAS